MHNNVFNVCINLTIVIASLAVGLETDNPEWGTWLGPINQLCLFIFTIELISKLVGLREFFWSDPESSSWNKFDFVIVGYVFFLRFIPKNRAHLVLRSCVHPDGF